MIDRRQFLGAGAAFGAACSLARAATKPLAIVQTGARSVRHSALEIDVPDTGWRMWPDRDASWKDDTIYLPEDLKLASLPVNAPTGGWKVLANTSGLAVTLPATVEQFHWGLQGLRHYKGEYKFEDTDDEVKNGAYDGVSWWWRSLDVPKAFQGKRIVLHVRGARQRAEVYLNGKLVGYSIMEELPFECDLTDAARPGESNQLAIRITNPGGRLDWRDGDRMSWGGFEFQKSHGFGGLDRGMVLSAHGSVRVADSWALNTPEPRTVCAHALMESKGPLRGILRFSVLEGSRTLTTKDVELTTHEVSAELNVPNARLWDIDSPHLYTLRSELVQDATVQAVRDVDFGFRWITTDGLGTDALIRLNGRRIRIYTAISWGFWALNGLFPTPELAEKEVRAAKQFGLNTLNFHRNLGKEDVLYVQDRVGLLRCLEPGGGSQAFQPVKAGHQSARRYMMAKLQGMIRAFRSHPSVIQYIIQNETTLDPESPELAELFAMMQREDPSRTIVGNDGFTMRAPQAWSAPYQVGFYKSKGKATEDGGAGGWWVDHTGHFSDVWQDTYYNSSTDFFYRSPIKAEIVEWGEMKGAASIDNHASVLRLIKANGGSSYDRVDHEEQLRAYDNFLDLWKFRAAFPTAAKLFESIGKRAYESWGQFLENVRICNENDMAAVSGWESTAIENHSGLVDNFRDFKSDPRPIRDALLPVRPIAKQKHLVLATGDRAIFDTYLFNDSDKPVTGTLLLSLVAPSGKRTRLARYAAPAFEKDRLSYLLAENVTTDPLTTPGTWTTEFAWTGSPDATHRVTLLVVDPAPQGFRSMRLATSSPAAQVEAALHGIPGITVESFRAGQRYDVIVGSGGAADASRNLSVDPEGAFKAGTEPEPEARLPDDVMAAVLAGTPLLAVTPADGQSVGVARQLAAAGAFRFRGMVGPSRASWMGSWYFVRRHRLYDGMPVDQAMGLHYQVKGGGSNGWMVEGDGVEIPCAYARDHDRNIGAGTLVARVGRTPVVLHRCVDMQPVLFRRFLANALLFLVDAKNV